MTSKKKAPEALRTASEAIKVDTRSIERVRRILEPVEARNKPAVDAYVDALTQVIDEETGETGIFVQGVELFGGAGVADHSTNFRHDLDGLWVWDHRKAKAEDGNGWRRASGPFVPLWLEQRRKKQFSAQEDAEFRIVLGLTPSTRVTLSLLSTPDKDEYLTAEKSGLDIYDRQAFASYLYAFRSGKCDGIAAELRHLAYHRISTRTGWVPTEASYVLPGWTSKPQDEKKRLDVVYDGETDDYAMHLDKGEALDRDAVLNHAAAWWRSVGRTILCSHAGTVAFGACLSSLYMRWVRDDMGVAPAVFMLYGASSSGKSVIASAIQSFVDSPVLRSATATANGMEGTLAEGQDCFVVLDEFGKDPNQAKKYAESISGLLYMVHGEQGKTRATTDGGKRPKARFKNVQLLLTSEYPIEHYLDRQEREGEQARGINLYATAQSRGERRGKESFSVFDDDSTMYGYERIAAPAGNVTDLDLIARIQSEADKHFGAGIRWLTGRIADEVAKDGGDGLASYFLARSEALTEHLKQDPVLSKALESNVYARALKQFGMSFAALSWTLQQGVLGFGSSMNGDGTALAQVLHCDGECTPGQVDTLLLPAFVAMVKRWYESSSAGEKSFEDARNRFNTGISQCDRNFAKYLVYLGNDARTQAATASAVYGTLVYARRGDAPCLAIVPTAGSFWGQANLDPKDFILLVKANKPEALAMHHTNQSPRFQPNPYKAKHLGLAGRPTVVAVVLPRLNGDSWELTEQEFQEIAEAISPAVIA